VNKKSETKQTKYTITLQNMFHCSRDESESTIKEEIDNFPFLNQWQYRDITWLER